MDPHTYEQEAVGAQLFAGQHEYFVEDLEAVLSFHNGDVVAGSAPQPEHPNLCSVMTEHFAGRTT